MSTKDLKAGQLVCISNPRNPSYGRIAMITGSDGPERKFVRFADLPPRANAVSPAFTCSLATQDLTGEDCPIASHYLLIEVVEVVGKFSYYLPCLAHVSPPFTCHEVALAVVRNWYEGDCCGWIEKEQAYIFTEFDQRVLVQCQHYSPISLGEYVQAQNYLTDRTPCHMANRSQ